MYILHGTWIPKEIAAFVQRGAFYLWVETGSARNTEPGYTVKLLPEKALAEFLADELGIGPGLRAIHADIDTLFINLPGNDGGPLPSPELARGLGVSLPEPAGIKPAPRPISGYPLDPVLQHLENLYFLASQRPDLQLGQDLLFWLHHCQSLRQVLRRDQYIPALKYRSLPGKAAGKFEIHPCWEIVSEDYETRLRQALERMPLACAAAFESADEPEAFYDKESLLRHFSECLLHALINRTKLTAGFTQKIRDTLLYECLNTARSTDSRQAPGALERYRQWQSWRQALAARHEEGFQLCFQLLEAADERSPWWIKFLAASRRDPSLRLELDDYWSLDAKTRQALEPSFGRRLEPQLLQQLGYAARMYPKLWQGLETDRPKGLALSLEEAFAFLKEHAWVLEDAGFKVIMPAWWTPQGRRRARLRLKAGGSKTAPSAAAGPGYFSLDALVKYRYELAIGGQTVTEQEWEQLVNVKTPLVQFRGQWLELDRDKMQQMLDFWHQHGQGEADITLGELLQRAAADDEEVDVGQDAALAEMLARLHDPLRLTPIADPEGIRGTLREYQKRGVAWLQYLESLGLNGCLADDMGLGKTLQVIARLVTAPGDGHGPTLLIAPTSVLGSWQKELEKFAPRLKAWVHHGTGRQRDSAAFQALCRGHDLVITSYTLARKDSQLLQGVTWQRVVIDEAQNIKNPKTAQTKAILKLKAGHRLALTGTPVENRLLDLWSIFHFLNPGYLGNQSQFRRRFELPIQKHNDLASSALLKKLVQPFILRRVKTDQAIIKDLPDKMEHKQYCNLTREQASLYEAVVKEVEREVTAAEGIQRKGLILSTLMRLKQICNHPRQFLQDGSEFTPERSHKLQRLGEMLEEVIAAGESGLIFTQFTEIGEALARYLSRALNYSTYYLHGGTPRARREQMIHAFQDPDSEPSVFILSLKAGGVGITLTRANHVFHFDRWWNPAVEDQATDRAFRIGQTRNVFVHKFVTLGTLEERIDQMIEDKKQMAGAIVGADESWLTELDNDSFKRLIALNRGAVLE